MLHRVAKAPSLLATLLHDQGPQAAKQQPSASWHQLIGRCRSAGCGMIRHERPHLSLHQPRPFAAPPLRTIAFQ